MTPNQADRDAAEGWRHILCHRDSEYEGDVVSDLANDFAAHRRAALEEAARVAEEYAVDCLMARGNASAMMDRNAVWQAEAERLSSDAIAQAIRALIDKESS